MHINMHSKPLLFLNAFQKIITCIPHRNAQSLLSQGQEQSWNNMERTIFKKWLGIGFINVSMDALNQCSKNKNKHLKVYFYTLVKIGRGFWVDCVPQKASRSYFVYLCPNKNDCSTNLCLVSKYTNKQSCFSSQYLGLNEISKIFHLIPFNCHSLINC